MKGSLAIVVLLLAGCLPRPEDTPVNSPNTPAARRAIWAAIVPMATAKGIDPGFVYAVVMAESDFDPRASRGGARGLMQIRPRVWRSVSKLPYEPSVWSWRTNLSVGIDALAAMKSTLSEKGVFSYAVLWASYHYGLDYVAARNFDLSRVPRPSDPVSYRLYSGEVHPLAAPR